MENSNDIDSLLNKALVKMDENNWDAGLTILDEALSLYPHSVMATLYKGVCLYSSKRWQEALELYNGLMKVAASDYAYYSRAMVHGALGDFQSMLDDSFKALQLREYQPGSSVQEELVLNNIATAYIELDEHEMAIEYLKECIHKSPPFIAPYLNLATVYQKKGQFDSTESILLQGIKSFPHDLDLLLALIDFYKLINKIDKAISFCDKALNLYPDDEDLLSIRQTLLKYQ
ncbi:tetratricopeptide repeat protein [Spirochaeta cellobiosiphila]|uniref:tetratricopeptide repeat protein n=1 Tax=Spirochaeta cellobiosiphila TaxID=504483 RepID=UPI00041B7DE0|nr:tetratricopeptide repeat protein [Spirochaeta cellobiosiphila]